MAGVENAVHTAEFVTPTGAPLHSTAPPPGPPTVVVSGVETHIGVALTQLHAA
jgi:hypothetical protein